MTTKGHVVAAAATLPVGLAFDVATPRPVAPLRG